MHVVLCFIESVVFFFQLSISKYKAHLKGRDRLVQILLMFLLVVVANEIIQKVAKPLKTVNKDGVTSKEQITSDNKESLSIIAWLLLMMVPLVVTIFGSLRIILISGCIEMEESTQEVIPQSKLIQELYIQKQYKRYVSVCILSFVVLTIASDPLEMVFSFLEMSNNFNAVDYPMYHLMKDFWLILCSSSCLFVFYWTLPRFRVMLQLKKVIVTTQHISKNPTDSFSVSEASEAGSDVDLGFSSFQSTATPPQTRKISKQTSLDIAPLPFKTSKQISTDSASRSQKISYSNKLSNDHSDKSGSFSHKSVISPKVSITKDLDGCPQSSVTFSLNLDGTWRVRERKISSMISNQNRFSTSLRGTKNSVHPEEPST